MLELNDVEEIETIKICNIYGPVLHHKNQYFWRYLEELRGRVLHFRSTLAGDFNANYSLSERRGGSNIIDPFGEMMEDLPASWNLTDIKPRKGIFTWNNKRICNIPIVTRIDWFLVSEHFLLKTTIPSTKIIPSSTFDHKPIILAFYSIENFGPVHFKFNPSWCNVPIPHYD